MSEDGRGQFHRAVMAVYRCVGELVAELAKFENLRLALQELDSILLGYSSRERGDMRSKTAMEGRVDALAKAVVAVTDLRQRHVGVGSAFSRRRSSERGWGGVAADSHHDIVVCAANVLLDGARPTDAIRDLVVAAVSNADDWDRLRRNLEKEYDRAALQPDFLGTVSETTTNGLFFLVSQLVESAREILSFRLIRTGHRIWQEELAPKLRASMRKLILDEEQANRAQTYAALGVDMAERGSWVAGTPPGRRSVAAAKKRHKRALARWQEARAALQANWRATNREQRLLMQKRMRDMAAVFSKLQRQYSDEFRRHVVEVTKHSAERPQLGSWTGASCCEVLEKVAALLVEVLIHGEDEDGDYLLQHHDQKRLDSITHEAWEQLHDGARKEAAFVVSDGKIRVRSQRKDSGTHEAGQSRIAARPTATAIDAAAKKCLEDALESAAEAGHPYVPSRGDLAMAVSKALNYEIGISSLFGTTERGGERAFRHPELMELWTQVQDEVRKAKRRHEAGE